MEKRIKEYKILTSAYYDLLEKEVNTYIFNGWQPFGNILANPNNASKPDNYIQTIVWYDS